MATCYRHTSRETGVSCSNCGRPICPDCMTPTSVGMRCPECAKQKTQVRTIQSIQSGTTVTVALIAINVVAFLASNRFGVQSGGGGGWLYIHGWLDGPDIHLGHDYWRLVTSGFLHANLLHILFNMYLLYVLGQILEPAIGPVRFGAIYLVALLAGSAGALLDKPLSPTVGASGAVFGLMGAAVVELRARGIDPMQSGIGGLILINLAFSFVFSSSIAIGGHIGGLIGGALAAYAVQYGDRRRSLQLVLGGCAILALAFAAIALAAAGGTGIRG